jgi:uncharacterized protein
MDAQKKYRRLQERLRDLGSVAVAFSGGTDSALLLYAAHEVLGDRALAFTASSPAFPRREQEAAEAFCRDQGIRQVVFPAPGWEDPEVLANPQNRCYLCKRSFLARLMELAALEGCAAVAEGSNVDDLGDDRPGMQAVAELGVVSPLREAGLTKAEIRALSRERNLATWNRPASACLASRIPYGEEITVEKLRMVEQGEDYLRSLGLGQLRIRLHGTLARLELLPEEFDRLLPLRAEVYDTLRSLGFSYIALDLRGYRTGSLNEKKA